MSYTICIRCRLIWVSLAVSLLHVALIGSLSPNWTNAEKITADTPRQEEPDTFTIDQLPSDGHLRSHQSSTLPTDVDCMCRQHTSQYTKPSSGGARIFYLVMLHNVHTIRDAVYLFRAIRDPRHIVVFHVDQKVQDAMYAKQENSTLLQSALQLLQDEILSCPCGSRVDLQSVHSVHWSKWSMNLPTLWGMELATSSLYKDKWDVFINLSGDTLPVYTPTAMARILQSLKYNFVTSRSCETGLIPTNVYAFPKSWHKRKHYTNNDHHPPPVIEFNDTNGIAQSTTINYFFGSQWVVLQHDFVLYLATELARTDSFVSRYRDHLRKTGKVMTDETFLPTVLMHVSPFNTTLPVVEEKEGSVVYTGKDDEILPRIYSIRYERMDEHLPSPLRGYFPKHPRYEVPVAVDGVLLPPEPHKWGPYYLGIYDLADIADSGALFLRKTSSVMDPNLYHILPVDHPSEIPWIQWPPGGIQASAVPNWRKEKLELMKDAVVRAKKEGQEVPEKFQKELQRLKGGKPAIDAKAEEVGDEQQHQSSSTRRELEAVPKTASEEEDL